MRGAALAATLVIEVVVVAMTAADMPFINTKDGRVSGIVEKSVKGREFLSFYGIPYAQPPLGKLRFKDPESNPDWGTRGEASNPAPPCIQYFSAEERVGRKEVLGEEDCLYLNVFVPKMQADMNFPVMVWLHGGRFTHGSAQEYPPHVLMDHNIVLVVVQYRLGVLGFLSTEDLVMPGNLGLKDQTLALRWVRTNIHLFGGDNTRVTVFSESAGSASVHLLMFIPEAQGTFSRAILQSGTALTPLTINNNPCKEALEVGSSLGCPTDRGSEMLLQCLQELDAKALFPRYESSRRWGVLPLTFTPWVDGRFLPRHPAQLISEGQPAQVDMISGITRDDGALFALPVLANKQLLEELQNNFSVAGPASLQLEGRSEDPEGITRQFYLHYLGTTNVTEAHAEGLMRMFTDHHFAVPHDRASGHHAGKIYRYELQHYAQLSFGQLICPSCDNKWVSHVDDLYYLFLGGPLLSPRTAPTERPKDLHLPDDLALRDIITTLWTNFAATGNPTPDGSLGFTWEASTPQNLQYLSLTPSPSMQPDDRKETRKFHNSLPIQENVMLQDSAHPSHCEL
ncbi:juvenile hormone esterase-like [Portunus trituberculatus]|uniref:juvenile hormone esterase-like n=1 Tax=Portunus trituberculatus TaxID=210409 RepID=UPI001E1CE691|nr:juvenile hormone esterase-like [Portunus trituberculatus]